MGYMKRISPKLCGGNPYCCEEGGTRNEEGGGRRVEGGTLVFIEVPMLRTLAQYQAVSIY